MIVAHTHMDPEAGVFVCQDEAAVLYREYLLDWSDALIAKARAEATKWRYDTLYPSDENSDISKARIQKYREEGFYCALSLVSAVFVFGALFGALLRYGPWEIWARC